MSEPTTLQEMHDRYLASRARLGLDRGAAREEPQRPQAPAASWPSVSVLASPPSPPSPEDIEAQRLARLRSSVADLVARNPEAWKARELVAIVAAEAGMSVDMLLSESRRPRLARPRQVAAWIVKHFTRLSLPDIGRRLGGRDHTTVLYGVRRVNALIDAGLVFPEADTPAGWAKAILAVPFSDWPPVAIR